MKLPCPLPAASYTPPIQDLPLRTCSQKAALPISTPPALLRRLVIEANSCGDGLASYAMLSRVANKSITPEHKPQQGWARDSPYRPGLEGPNLSLTAKLAHGSRLHADQCRCIIARSDGRKSPVQHPRHFVFVGCGWYNVLVLHGQGRGCFLAGGPRFFTCCLHRLYPLRYPRIDRRPHPSQRQS